MLRIRVGREFQTSGDNEITFDRRFCADSSDSEEFLLTRPERKRVLTNVEQNLKIWWRAVESGNGELVIYSEFDR